MRDLSSVKVTGGRRKKIKKNLSWYIIIFLDFRWAQQPAQQSSLCVPPDLTNLHGDRVSCEICGRPYPQCISQLKRITGEIESNSFLSVSVYTHAWLFHFPRSPTRRQLYHPAKISPVKKFRHSHFSPPRFEIFVQGMIEQSEKNSNDE